MYFKNTETAYIADIDQELNHCAVVKGRWHCRDLWPVLLNYRYLHLLIHQFKFLSFELKLRDIS